MPPALLLDPTTLDFTKVIADLESIRKINLQRYEMEQLTAVVYEDTANHVVAGYKDVAINEFWVRGHMPGYPLFPGVLMCEAAAQLCSFYAVRNHLLEGDFVGFGGLENVRFRSPVHAADRLVLIGKAVRVHRRQTIFNVQGFVGATMVFHADVIGVPMSKAGG
jgi:3-hydroxyacyl-[acyl-carrier-protein] dehydratase